MDTQSADTNAWFDMQSLSNLRAQGRQQSPETVEKVAREFESLFVRMMIKSMRDTSIGDELFDSDASKQYRDMYDQQMAVNISQQGGFGLADVLVRQLLNQGQTTDAAPRTFTVKRAFPIGNAQDETRGLPLDGAPRSFPITPAPTGRVFSLPEGGAASDEDDTSDDDTPVAASSGDGKAASNTVAYAENLAMTRTSLPTPGLALSKAEPTASTDTFSGEPNAFIQQFWPLAEKAGRRLGVPPQVLLAQAGLETGWGKAIVRSPAGESSFNLFNIKADGRWDGERMSKSSIEYKQGLATREASAFRAYGSYEESFDDYVAFLESSPRYRQALENSEDYQQYVQELQRAGYATDPDYANKIIRIINREPLLSMNRA